MRRLELLNEKRVEFKSRFRSWFELNCLDLPDMTGGHTIENEWNLTIELIDHKSQRGSSEKYRVIPNLGYSRF